MKLINNLFTLILFVFMIVMGTSKAQTWLSQTSGTTQTLRGVSFSDLDKGTAVGTSGTILRTTNAGNTWFAQLSGTTVQLNGVHFFNVDTGIVVGNTGTILRTTNGGTTWITIASGVTNNLLSVSFPSDSIGTAVGTGGRIMRTTDGGITWVSQTSGTTAILDAVSFLNDSMGLATGLANILLTTNGGQTWVNQASGGRLYSVRFVTENIAYAAGASGRIIKTTNGGSTWEALTSGVTNQLNSVFFTDSLVGTAVGSLINLRTINGGLSWNIEGTGQALQAVFLNDENIGTAVGQSGVIIRRTLAPAPPTNLIAVPDTFFIDLYWEDNSLNEVGFIIERQLGEIENAFEVIDTVAANDTAFTDTGLLANTTYTYRIFAYNEFGESGYSNTAEATTLAITITTFPYVQDFEGTTFPPVGWENYGDKFWSAGSEAHSGLKAARVSYTPSGTANLVTPDIVLPATPDHRIKFWWKDDDITSAAQMGNEKQFNANPDVEGFDTTFFEISTNGGTTWTELAFLSAPSPMTEYVEEIISLSAHAGQTVKLRWRDVVVDGAGFNAWGVGLDDITIEETPSGPPDPALLVSPPDAGTNIFITATLNWSPGGGAAVTGYRINFGTDNPPTNIENNTDLGDVTTYTPAALLTYSTTYYWEIIPYNVDGSAIGTVIWSFTTQNDPTITTFPFVETFEDDSPSRIGWTQIQEVGAGDWTYAAGAGGGLITISYEGLLNARFVSVSGTNSPITKLVSPPMDLTSVAAPSVDFFYGQEEWFGDQNDLKIYYRVSLTDPWVEIAHFTGNVSSWTNASLLLPNPSATYQIAFEGINNWGRANVVDLVTVGEATANDIGVSAYAQPTTESILSTGYSREYLEKNPSLKKELPKVSVFLKPVGNNFSADAPIDFEVIVENFGSATQNSYQVGWEIDGTTQTSVSNSEPLEPGDIDTLTLTWAVPVAGVHTSRAWTELAGDQNPANDTSGIISFYAVPENSVFLEGFEDATFPPAGWLDIDADGSGISWFAGNPGVFPAITGYGYAGANFQGANASNVIDQWLITPNTGGLTEATDTDSLVFYVRTPAGSSWPDSIEIRVSTTGTDIADFTILLDYIEVPVNDQWNRFAYELPSAADRYIAFRYLIFDAINNSNYFGLDLVEIQRHTTGGSTFSLTVSVLDGWNMVSIPGLNTPDQNVNTWWAFRDLGANVFRYEGGYQSVTDAVPGIGYWMKHSGDRTYNTGDEWPAGGIQIVAHNPIAAESGWNLFGGYELSVTAANVTTNPPGLQNGPIYKYSGGYQVATTIDPGYGYWMKLDAAGQIIIPETMAKGKVVEYFPEDWGKIILTDATGINYTLYAVKGEVNLDNYELPPAPPTGMFDIRFSSGRIAEDINSSVKTIDLSGVTYPLTVRVEGMDIKLMDETGKTINANLKKGEDIVISDATIQKLMVSGELLPTVYSLEQNYPNPFNPSTVIEFSLPENVGNVQLSIYNMLGEKVAELVNTALTAGKYQYQWNARDVATGMYIYELRTEKFVSVKKMLLLK